MSNLALSMMEFRDAYISAEQWDVALRLVKWGMDWLVKAHVKASDSPAENAFVGQVGCCWDLCGSGAGASPAGNGVQVHLCP